MIDHKTLERIQLLEQYISDNAEDILERGLLLSDWCKAYEDNNIEAMEDIYNRTQKTFEAINITLREEFESLIKEEINNDK